ncbi:hypothetical protein FMEXI_5080 [Fusarium mexicanum]|uniref:Uncharacterized protein n=1 Tax=Fusarium mexicanum TaxID=751941 RepID=A0A8H5J2M5_9HYPO|nr:hypothetical protein FMEXI_5080 [Fusarium mexicanum]
MSDDYLDFRPIASRRPHVRAYLKYMYPDLGPSLDKRWAAATLAVCRTYTSKGAENVHAPLFDFLVDRAVWDDYFFEIKCQHESLVKTPRWPFRITPEMMQDNHPSSREYAEYVKNVRREKRKTARRGAMRSDISAKAVPSNGSSSSVPQVPLPTPNPTTYTASNGAVDSLSQSPSTGPPEINPEALTRSPPRGSSEQKQRQDLWELAGGETTFRPPIIGPFQMKLPEFAPLNSFVTGPDFEDLKRITKDFLPRVLALKIEITTNYNRDVDFNEVLTLMFANGCGDKTYDRVELVRFWGYMTEWLSKVYHGEPTILREHLFDAVMSSNRKLEPVSANLDDLYFMHSRLCKNGE